MHIVELSSLMEAYNFVKEESRFTAVVNYIE
jgi:hypothetical protein